MKTANQTPTHTLKAVWTLMVLNTGYQHGQENPPDANPKSPALTFSFKKKEDKQDDQIPKADSVSVVDGFNDSIPF